MITPEQFEVELAKELQARQPDRDELVEQVAMLRGQLDDALLKAIIAVLDRQRGK